jgi:hypothetical protein
MKVGDKVRVRDQDITGTVIRFDWNGDVVIVDDEKINDEEVVLVYPPDELIPVMGDDFFGNCTNCVDW